MVVDTNQYSSARSSVKVFPSR